MSTPPPQSSNSVAAKRQRICGPKVKTGCQTCKVRRLKCDETKPACKRCTRTGRTCDGYTFDPILFQPSITQTAFIVHHMSTRPPGNTREKRGFQFFIANTVAELTSYYASPFWDYLVVQASVAEPSLRHAVVAIGALHEEFLNKKVTATQQECCQTKNQDDEIASEFARNQYTKAISELRRSLVNGKQAPVTALMSCILFVIFDSLRGSLDSAIIHLRSGLRILEEVRRTSKGEEEEFMIENRIVPLFTRLCLQAILYADTRERDEKERLASQLVMIEDKRKPLTENFDSLEEARETLSRESRLLVTAFNALNAGKLSTCNRHECTQILKDSAARLAHWESRFNAFVTSHSHTMNARQIRGTALLRIHYTVGLIMCRLIPHLFIPDPSKEGIVHEELAPHFQLIVTLSTSVINAAEKDMKFGKPSLTFTADLGLVGPLWFVCKNCRVREIREESLALIGRCPRREGMWHSELAETVRRFWG